MSDSPTAEVDQKQIEVIKQDKILCIAHRVAMGKAGGDYIYCLEEDKFYFYENGIYVYISETEFLAKISDNIREITKLSLPRRKQILENYKLVRYRSLKDFNWSHLLTLNNNMINPYDGEDLPHDKSYLSTIKLKYDYKKDSPCDLWIKTLNEIFDNDHKKIMLLQEFFGYCLVPDMEQKKALLLLGESDTGKSTILFTLRDLIGSNNCSSVPLKYLGNPQYTPMMINKLVNIDADVDKNAANYEAEFKMVTSGEPINCNQKFIETFEFIPKCKIVLAANIFPKITDHSSAFYKRLLLIPCDRIFDEKEKNRNLSKELKKELSGILEWSIKGLRRLKERGMFEQHDFMKNAVQELEDENNPAYLFFNDHIEIDLADGIYIEKNRLYEKYREWSDKNGAYKLSNVIFGKAVFKKYNKETPKLARLTGNGPYIWRNIKYVEVKTEKTEVKWQPEVVETPNQQGINWEE